jgi:hypothetical protein
MAFLDWTILGCPHVAMHVSPNVLFTIPRAVRKVFASGGADISTDAEELLF